MRKTALALLLLGIALPRPSLAGIAGVCPDGSLFIVQRIEDTPCKRAKYVEDPSELPPIRPELLENPHTWEIDRQAKDPNNPYNLLDRARAVRAGVAQPESPAGAPAQTARPPVPAPLATGPRAPEPLRLALTREDMRDLVRLVALRQDVAPATFTVDDIERNEQLFVRLAHSAAFQERVLSALGRVDRHVLLFQVRSVASTDFHPNFFFVSEGATFRVDPQNPQEVGWLVGEAGEMEPGMLLLGYLVVPQRFDPARELEIWWNDRSLEAVLAP